MPFPDQPRSSNDSKHAQEEPVKAASADAEPEPSHETPSSPLSPSQSSAMAQSGAERSVSNEVDDSDAETHTPEDGFLDATPDASDAAAPEAKRRKRDNQPYKPIKRDHGTGDNRLKRCKLGPKYFDPEELNYDLFFAPIKEAENFGTDGFATFRRVSFEKAYPNKVPGTKLKVAPEKMISAEERAKMTGDQRANADRAAARRQAKIDNPFKTAGRIMHEDFVEFQVKQRRLVTLRTGNKPSVAEKEDREAKDRWEAASETPADGEPQNQHLSLLKRAINQQTRVLDARDAATVAGWLSTYGRKRKARDEAVDHDNSDAAPIHTRKRQAREQDTASQVRDPNSRVVDIETFDGFADFDLDHLPMHDMMPLAPTNIQTPSPAFEPNFAPYTGAREAYVRRNQATGELETDEAQVRLRALEMFQAGIRVNTEGWREDLIVQGRRLQTIDGIIRPEAGTLQAAAGFDVRLFEDNSADTSDDALDDLIQY